MTAYVDASFLISLFSPDANSLAATQIMAGISAKRCLTVFTWLEVTNALELRVFRKEITATEARKSWADFAQDVRDGVFVLVPLPEHVFERALGLSQQTTRKLGTRTADLLHVAAALELHADLLLSFDHQQRKLARAVGLEVS